MDDIARLCALLEEKKNKMLEYEQATLAMLECPPDDIDQYITRRGMIANSVDEIREEMGRLADSAPGGGQMLQAADARLAFETVPSEYQCLYYAGQAVRSVASRVRETERQVLDRIEKLRDEALTNVRQAQNLPKIRRYLTNLTDNPQDAGVDRGQA